MSAALQTADDAVFRTAASLALSRGFYREAKGATVAFCKGGPELLVSFCNLASFTFPPEARLPWLFNRAESWGWSHLGVMSREKDWYRNADAPDLLRDLAADGFFDGFDRILFAGTSMGGFAALNLQSIVPGADVIAFSPQSTLNPEIAPFEDRYPWPLRKFDWESPEFLDAADYVGRARRAWVLFDPMVPEDQAHAARLALAGAEEVACPLMGHQLPNALKRAGVLDLSLKLAMSGDFDRVRFYREFRTGRRTLSIWRKELVQRALACGQRAGALAICEATMRDQPGPWFRKMRKRLLAEGVE